MAIFPQSPTAKTAYQYNLKDELVQAEDTDVTAGDTLLDRETWGLDAAGGPGGGRLPEYRVTDKMCKRL